MSAVARSNTDDLRRLVELAQQGDREALEALYLLHFDRIYSYLHMSVGNRHDAEDLTTQTFLKMLEAIGRFRWQSAPFSAWLFLGAHNLALDHFPPPPRPHPPGRGHVPAPPRAGSPRRRCRSRRVLPTRPPRMPRCTRSAARACSS